MFILTSPFPPLIHDVLRQHLRSGSTGHIARWLLLLLRVCIQAGVPSQLRFAAVHTDAVSNPFNLQKLNTQVTPRLYCACSL